LLLNNPLIIDKTHIDKIQQHRSKNINANGANAAPNNPANKESKPNKPRRVELSAAALASASDCALAEADAVKPKLFAYCKRH
jgi:hypothetical protein